MLFSESDLKRSLVTKPKRLSPPQRNAVETIRVGKAVTIFTIGYERRDGDDLMNALREHGIKALADVRQRPMSRKPDFRAKALRAFCDEAAIEYQPWPVLGSTVEQRDELQASGDFDQFAADFRSYALAELSSDLMRLAASVAKKPTALLCYERLHTECHRSVIAELVGDKIDATIVAIQ